MEANIKVENIKCGGCANSIKTKLMVIDGVVDVAVDVDNGAVLVSFSGEAEAPFALVKQKLLSMGYPETGSIEGLSAAGAKAKSFVSCAIGKITEDK